MASVQIDGPGVQNPSGQTLDTPPPLSNSAKRPATILEQAQARASGAGPGGDLNTDFTMAQALLQRIAVKVPALRDPISGMLVQLMQMAPQAMPQQGSPAGAPQAGGQIPMPPPPGAGMGM